MSQAEYEPIVQAAHERLSYDDNPSSQYHIPESTSAGKWLATAGLCLASIGVYTDASVITVGLPQISSNIDLMEYFAWSSGAFLLTACVAQPIFGRFYTLGYRKSPLIYGVVFYHLGATLCSFANSVFMFVVGRAVSGVGAASLYTGGQAVIVSLFSADDVALCLSVFSFISTTVGMAFPVICGIIIDLYTWRLIFFLSLPFSLVGLGLISYAFRSDRTFRSSVKWYKQVQKTDLIGTSVLVVAFGSLLLPIMSESMAWGCGRLVAFTSLLGVFGYLQYSNPSSAMIPPKVFAFRQVWICSIIACSLEMAIFTHLFYLSLFYQAVKNYSAKASGTQETMYIFTMTSASLFSGAMVTRVGRTRLSMGVGIAIFAIAASLLCNLNPDTAMLNWIPFTLGSAFGAGACLQLPFAIVAAELGDKYKVTGNAILVFSHSLGGPIGTSLAHLIFSAKLLQGLQKHVPELDPHLILSTAVTRLRSVVPEQSLDAVLAVYSQAVNYALLLAVFATLVAGISTIFLTVRR